ncbi:MAG: adenosylcobalamin-dependent ribonucleoside-diphosphate reductase [Spirochaetales bacterium]|nr:adenosylcobalamin-dependent ribonucleoside-diphosphate reductase [Spirochaetales bacterium]
MVKAKNTLSPLGRKIFLDRYALKDAKKETLKVDDTVIVVVNKATGQREIGKVTAIDGKTINVELEDGTTQELSLEQLDKPIETDPSMMIKRVSTALGESESEEIKSEWVEKFKWLMDDWRFVPAGRILTGAGTNQNLTFYNCYVIPSPADSRGGIMETLGYMTEIMSRGGGVGINLSSLRPHHAYVKGVNGRSSGSVSWGALYSYVTGLIEQGGSRRGALMLILNDSHPDIMDFISSKRKMGQITNANISVAISDAFMEAVKADSDWDLVFPDTNDPEYDELWRGDLGAWKKAGKPVITHKTVKARTIWDAIIESAWSSAEPGIFFVDRYNKMSNSYYYSTIQCTNPCGEQGLPPWGVCNLGALNLSRFVDGGDVDWDSLRKGVRYAVRFLDNIIDTTPYFFDVNKEQQMSERRIGLGTMGLAEMMIELKIRYGSEESEKFIDKLFKFIAVESYLASSDYAKEKGSFPMFDADKYLKSGFMKGMPKDVKDRIKENGIRNVTLLTQAPTGTTGTMVGTSTGIEPYYFWEWERVGRMGSHTERVPVYDEWKKTSGDKKLPDYFVTAMDLAPEDHVKVQAAIQKWVDSSISKTSNTPNQYTVDQTKDLYQLMYDTGCKGGTIYRDGSRDEQVLYAKKDDEEKVKEQPKPSVDIKPRVRPTVLFGTTYRKHTPIGTAYITVNAGKGAIKEPFEVFINVAKVGSDVAADAEGLGRLISLILRMPSPLSPVERVGSVIGQLRSIGSGRHHGFGKNRVMSLPDAVAQVLEEHIGKTNDDDFPVLPDEEDELAAQQKQFSFSEPEADLCPVCGNATFMFIEGCQKCHSCGHSEC